MSDQPPIWDARIWNDGQIAEKCMALGAVILKPSGHRPIGFAPSVIHQDSRDQEERS